MTAEQKLDGHRLGKLGRRAPAAVAPIIGLNQSLCNSTQVFLRKGCLTGLVTGQRLLQMTCHLPAHARDFLRLLPPSTSDTGKDIAKGWHVVTRHWRKISSGIKWLEVGH